MTRGPPPLKAIAKAQAVAALQGTVRNHRMLVQSRYSFVLFRNDRTVFVRIKRIRAHVSDPKEIFLLFRTDVLQLRMLPKTPVTSREIWTLSPWNVWQFFVIEDDRIVEVRYEVPLEIPPAEKAGTDVVPTAPQPEIPCTNAPLPAGPEPDGTVPAGDPSAPADGNTGGTPLSDGGVGDGRGVKV